MKGDRTRPVQFSLRSLFVVTLLVSVALAVAMVIGRLAIAFAVLMVPAAIVVTAYIVKTIKRHERATFGEVAVAVAISFASALIVLLGLAMIASVTI